MNDAEVEGELRKLRDRRKRHRQTREELRKDTERVMQRVSKTNISVSQACRLAGISRSSVYQDFE